MGEMKVSEPKRLPHGFSMVAWTGRSGDVIYRFIEKPMKRSETSYIRFIIAGRLRFHRPDGSVSDWQGIGEHSDTLGDLMQGTYRGECDGEYFEAWCFARIIGGRYLDFEYEHRVVQNEFRSVPRGRLFAVCCESRYKVAEVERSDPMLGFAKTKAVKIGVVDKPVFLLELWA